MTLFNSEGILVLKENNTISDILWQGTVGSILDRKDETKSQAVVCQQLGKCLFCVCVLIVPELNS